MNAKLPEGSPSAVNPFAVTHPSDRDAVMLAIGLCWLGLLSGFVLEIAKNFAAGYRYVPAAHLHAASAVGWMVLLTWQAMLVRRDKVPAHCRNGGRFGWWLAPVVVVSALVTVWMADRAVISAGGDFPPERLAFQIGHIIPFAVLTSIALVRTDRPDLHKRMILLGVIAMLDTGWSRWLGEPIRAMTGPGAVGDMLVRFPLTWALMIAMATYDYRTRGRIHPAFLPATALILATEFGALALYHSPWWRETALWMLGF